MSEHNKIMTEIAAQYEFLSGAVLVGPGALAHRVYQEFCEGGEDPCIQYASLEQIKQMARKFLAIHKDADANKSESYQAAMEFEGERFSGRLQDRYPLPRQKGEEPVYKLRTELTPGERAWNVEQLRKSAKARQEHADALEAEGYSQERTA
jgi:hypothetical protein